MGPRGLLGRQRQPRADSRHRRFPVSLAAAQPWQGDPAAPARRLCPRPRRGVTLGCSVLAQRAPAGPGLSGACFVKWGLPHTPRPYAHPPSRACEPPGTQQLPVTPPPSQPHRGAPASPERGWGSPQTCPAQPPPPAPTAPRRAAATCSTTTPRWRPAPGGSVTAGVVPAVPSPSSTLPCRGQGSLPEQAGGPRGCHEPPGCRSTHPCTAAGPSASPATLPGASHRPWARQASSPSRPWLTTLRQPGGPAGPRAR